MHSTKYYSFEPRDSREYGDATSGHDSGRSTYVSNMYVDPKESKIERENYLTKDDSKRVSKNITKSVITRSVIDKRSTSSYRTREDSQSIKTRDLQGILGRDPARITLRSSYDMNGAKNENEAPISSFYSSYSKDEDLSDGTKLDQPEDNSGDVISSFYRSNVGTGSDRINVDFRTRTDDENKDSIHTSRNFPRASGVTTEIIIPDRYMEEKGDVRQSGLSRTGLYATGGESWRSGDKTDSSGSLGRQSSLDRLVTIRETETASDRETDDSRKINLEDTHILRRALERKQASNSLERERLSTKFSEDDRSDPSKHTSRAYLSFSERNGTGSPQRTASQYPKTRSSVTSFYDLDYKRNARTGNDDVTDRLKKFEVAAERLARPTRSTDTVEFPGKIRTRSRSSERLDAKERSRLGIYQELPGRKEFLSYSRSLPNTAPSRSDEDKHFSKESRRTGSLERYGSSRDYESQGDRDSRASLLRQRSRSSEELSSIDKDKENDIYPSYRSRPLHRQGGIERDNTFGRDVTNRRDIRRREMGPSSNDKLREDIAKLKAAAKSPVTRKGDIKLYSFSTQPSIQDKLKEDIAKLKADTLTRDRGKPYIPPYSSRTEPAKGISSRWKSREPSIQDKLKEDIAKLKAETRNFPSLSRKASGVTTEMIIPDRNMETSGDVRQSGLTRTSIERYNLSKRDGDVFKDELRSEETQRYGNVKDHKEGYTTHKHGALRMDDKPVSPDELTYTERNVRDEVFPESSRDYYRTTRDHGVSFPRRPSEGAPATFPSRIPDDDSSPWPRADESRLIERKDSMTSPRKVWDDPQRTTRETRVESTQGYASKRVFRADSTMSIASTKDAEGGPRSVRGYFRGSVSKEDHSAYFSRGMGDRADGYHEPTSIPEPVRRPDEAIPLPYPGHESISRRPEDSISRGSRDESKQQDKEEKREVHSDKVYSSREFVTRKTIKEDPVISRESSKNDVTRLPSRVDTSRRFSERSESSPRRTSIREEIIKSEEKRRPYPMEFVSPIPEYTDSERSPRRTSIREEIIKSEEKRSPYPRDFVAPIPEYTDSEPSPRRTSIREEIVKSEEEKRSSYPKEFVAPIPEYTDSERSPRRTSIREEIIKSEEKRSPYPKEFVAPIPEYTDSEPSPRRTSIREEIIKSEEKRIHHYPEEFVAPLPEHTDRKPSKISELRKKIDQLKSKVDSLDDTRARMHLERYVDEHSEKKPDVEIKDPVDIRRYQLSERRSSETTSVVDGADPQLKRASIDVTSETISRQISRQTSQASSIRRISSIREEDLRTTPRTPGIDESAPEEVFPEESKPDEKPIVVTKMCDAETMTAPEIQEHVGTDVIRRRDSTVSEIVDMPDKLEELRGVPIDQHQIEEVGTGEVMDSGVTTIQIDNQQQTLLPKKDKRGWWNVSTAEDVDRLLELGKWGPWNAFTAEDVDKVLQLGPVRRRSLRRGSYERRSFRRYPRRSMDDHVDVHVKVRGRQETRSRPQCIVAQAAPEEKAIVLRDAKESADPFIRKIKVDDVYGADAVRVENGVVKIKVGDLTSRGRRAWARILQQKNRIIESDGTVTIPVSSGNYEDGMYHTNYYQGQEQDGAMRMPIKFKIQEQNKARPNKLRVIREIKRTGSMRRNLKRRAAGSRAYIVGARYYSDNMMVKSVDGSRSQGSQREVVLRQQQDSSTKVTGNEIVLRRSSQPPAFPMQSIQRIHEGHRTTRQAASSRNEGGKMVITVHAVPPLPPKYNLKQVAENMTSSSYHGGTSNQRGVSGTSGNYYITSTSGGGGGGGGGISGTSRGYMTSSTSGRQGTQGTSYYVTDPSDTFGRRSGKSGYHGVTRVHISNEMASTPTIIPYEDDVISSRRGTQEDSFIADPPSFYGYYDAPGSRICATDPRLSARTSYGEKFNLRDHGGVSSVQYVNGAREGSRIINGNMNSNGRYRYGSSWNSKQQEKLNGRTIAWAVEEVAPDF